MGVTVGSVILYDIILFVYTNAFTIFSMHSKQVK